MLEVHPTHLAGDDHLGGIVPAGAIGEIRLNRWPAEVVLHDGRIGFVSNVRRRDLELFGRLHGIPVVEREDVWSLLTEDFLDTENDPAHKETTLHALEACGFLPDEVAAIRRFVGPAMLLLTAMTWEWVHYGLWDVLQARPTRILPRWGSRARHLPRDRSTAELRRWAEAIANRAPVRVSVPFRAEPDADTVLRSLRRRFPSPRMGRDPDVLVWIERNRRFETVRDEVLAAWSGPGRHYHAPRHLLAVLDAVAPHTPPAAFALAAWFHDAVYDPTRTDNEEESARWLQRAAEPLVAPDGLETDDVTLALRMVRATARPLEPMTDTPENRAVFQFLDADFQVFASVPEDYDRYVAGVRAEYGFVPEDLFHAGRLAFLGKLRAEVDRRGWFFRESSPLAESLARQNLDRELASLRDMSTP